MKDYQKTFLILLTIIAGLVFTLIYVKRTSEVKEPPRVLNTRMKFDRIVIAVVDTVEGRPTYNVIFEDEDVMDSMYGEEIGQALATGKWEYNEDLRVK